jgi:hypothetical protein
MIEWVSDAPHGWRSKDGRFTISRVEEHRWLLREGERVIPHEPDRQEHPTVIGAKATAELAAKLGRRMA